jgi:pimeloyl-ACP methyl ester carboxylesterase
VKASSTPKLDRTIELADGRTLAYSEWGDLGGRPVVFLHGTPSSRLLCWDVDATEALGVRLVTVDRSGYGRSDPRADVTLLNWVDDYIELVDHLGLPSCPVLGHSGGGPYALACAYRLPERVSSLGLAASPGLIHETPGALDGLSPEERADYDLFRRDRVAGIEAIRRRCQWYDGEGWQTLFTESWGQADDRVLARPDVLEANKENMREGARQGSMGLALDYVVDAQPDGFSVADVRQEVHVWIGDSDAAVAPFHADYLVSTIPRATLVSFPGGGHLFPFDWWGDMLAALT